MLKFYIMYFYKIREHEFTGVITKYDYAPKEEVFKYLNDMLPVLVRILPDYLWKMFGESGLDEALSSMKDSD